MIYRVCYILSLVWYILFVIYCLLYDIFCLLYIICMIYHVCCILSAVWYIVTDISCLLYDVSCLLYIVCYMMTIIFKYCLLNSICYMLSVISFAKSGLNHEMICYFEFHTDRNQHIKSCRLLCCLIYMVYVIWPLLYILCYNLLYICMLYDIY